MIPGCCGGVSVSDEGSPLWILKTPGMGQGLESKGGLGPYAKSSKKGGSLAGRSGDSRTEVREEEVN